MHALPLHLLKTRLREEAKGRSTVGRRSYARQVRMIPRVDGKRTMERIERENLEALTEGSVPTACAHEQFGTCACPTPFPLYVLNDTPAGPPSSFGHAHPEHALRSVDVFSVPYTKARKTETSNLAAPVSTREAQARPNARHAQCISSRALRHRKEVGLCRR